MKTYEQVLNQAVLSGFHSYFGGGSMYAGAHEFLSGATFIFEVSSDQFLNDFERELTEVRAEMALNGWTTDQLIAYLTNR